MVAVLSGGNIDPLLMLRVIQHGLAAAGRYLPLTVRCNDRPGQLALLLSQIGEHRGNVVDVIHRGRTRTCASARSRWRSRWRPGGRSTPTG